MTVYVLAGALADNLAADRRLARELADCVTGYLDGHALAYDLVRRLAQELKLARDLLRDLSLAGEVFGTSNGTGNEAHAVATELVHDLERAGDLAGQVNRLYDLPRDLVVEHVGSVASRLYDEIEVAAVRAADLGLGQRDDEGNCATRVAPTAGVVPAPAGSVVLVYGWVVTLLSAKARCRFGDELKDELYDLAEVGASWRQQMACVLRQLGSVRQLRRDAHRAETSPRAASREG